MKPRFDAILFDLGSTLLYFDGPWPDIIAQADAELVRCLRAAGLDLEPQAFTRRFEALLDAYYTQRETEFIEYTTAYIVKSLLQEWGYAEPQDQIVRAALQAMYRVYEDHWHIEADTHSTLQALHQAGVRLGLISNAGDDSNVQRLIDNASIRPYFEVILTSAAQGIRKPNPRIFHTALNHLAVQPARAAMVGDTLGADILGARNAGIYSVWITRRADTPANHAHLDTIQPDATVATLAELTALLY